MSFTKMTTDVLNVSALPNKPTIPATNLKAVFDTAGVSLKTFMNTLIDEMAQTTGASNIGADVSTVTTKTIQAVLTAFEASIADRYTKTQTEALVGEETNDLVSQFDINLNTGIITITKKDGTQSTFDTALEKVPATFELLEENGIYYLKITNVDGSTSQIDVTTLFNEYNFAETSNIAFSVSGEGNIKTVSAEIRDNSIGIGKLNLEVITQLEAYVQSASDSASAAKISETNANGSADTAVQKASEANNSALLATQKAEEAGASATNSSNSATIATQKAEEAGASASSASSSATTATQKAKESETNASSANSSATIATQKAGEALASATNANNSATIATQKAGEAGTSASSASSSATTAIQKAGEATTSASNASSSATTATQKAQETATNATLAKSYAVGGTGTREGEDTDNASYYSGIAKDIAGGDYITASGNISNTTTSFTEASTRENILSGEKTSTIFGKIKKFFSSLKAVAFSGEYSDLNNIPTAFTPATHTHAYNDLNNIPTTFTPATHTHSFADLTNKPTITTQTVVTNFWTGTQAEYDAITTKVATTLYLIEEE